MQFAEDELIDILKNTGVDLISSLPCDRIKNLLLKIPARFEHIALAREEAGVGISAGAALAGRRPAMIIQNSGIGNMINALLSLTLFYRLPLALFLSHRGVYKEKIAAQVPMGKHVSGILKASGIGYTNIKNREELHKVIKPLESAYMKEKTHAFLLSPRIWEGSLSRDPKGRMSKKKHISSDGRSAAVRLRAPHFERFQIIEKIALFIKGKLVVCNLGFPAKELYHILHQPSNFYMLGSMGMATPIGFGVAISCKKEVVVIDGDGSLLMNPGILATIALNNPSNLTIIVIDNGVYSSTGDQPTSTQSVTHLSIMAEGLGLRNIFTVSEEKEILSAMRSKRKGTKFIHVIAKKGNRVLPIIPLSADVIKKDFMTSVAA